MRDLGAPHGKLPFKERSCAGLPAAAGPGWWPRAGDTGPCGTARGERGAGQSHRAGHCGEDAAAWAENQLHAPDAE